MIEIVITALDGSRAPPLATHFHVNYTHVRAVCMSSKPWKYLELLIGFEERGRKFPTVILSGEGEAGRSRDTPRPLRQARNRRHFSARQ